MLCLYKSLDQMSTEFYRAFIVQKHSANWAVYQNNPECVKTMLNNEYWLVHEKLEKAEEQEVFGAYVFMWIAISTVILAIIILVIFFLRRKSPSDDTQETTRL